jgi:hypothetical protein
VLEASGVMDECRLFGDKLRLTRTISTRGGAKSLMIHDVVENFGHRRSPFTILYHINFGFPLLDAASRAVIHANESTPFDEPSKGGLAEMLSSSPPRAAYREQNFTHRMAVDDAGWATAALIHPTLDGGLGVVVRFDGLALPYLNQWKMLGEGEYVMALEPCNAPCVNRGVLRERGLLPFLAAGETRELRVEIGVLESAAEIAAFEARTTAHARTEQG